MPAHVENLLVEINLVRVRLFAHPRALAGRTVGAAVALLAVLTGARARRIVHRCGYANFLGLECALVCLQHDLGVLAFFRRVDHEIVVVRAGHDVLAVAGVDDLELVEYRVIFVRVAKSGPQMLVDGDGLHGLGLLPDVPNLDRKIVAGKDVAAVIGETHVGDGGDDFGEE